MKPLSIPNNTRVPAALILDDQSFATGLVFPELKPDREQFYPDQLPLLVIPQHQSACLKIEGKEQAIPIRRLWQCPAGQHYHFEH